MSPILDSVFMSWWMADVPVGPARESMCSILADIGPVMGLPPALSRYARVFAESRMGVYRLTELEPDRVELEELSTGARVCARLPPDLHGRGTLWLTRLLPPIVADDADWVVWTTPYLLQGPDYDTQWLAYCERVAGAAPAERGERLARHFKAADDPRRWTEYIMNGYAGENPAGSIVLLGVPDRPKTLPQHEDYDAVAAMDPDSKASPLERLRIRLHALAAEHEFVAQEPPPAPMSESLFPEAHRLMALAYRAYGQIDREGRTAVDLLLEDAASLPDEERRELAALAAGWFSAFEILHVRVDEGMELRDVFGGRKLWISERSATRQVELGDLLVGWVMVYVEDAIADRRFLLRMAEEPFRRSLLRLEQRGLLRFAHGGDPKHAAAIGGVVDPTHNRRVDLRTAAIFDSDARQPGVASRESNLLASICAELVHFHQLRRRAIENYLTRNALQGWAYGSSSQRRLRGKLYSAFVELSAEQRNHFNMKRGFAGDLSNAEAAGSLYSQLTPQLRRNLEHGFGTDIEELFSSDSVRAADLRAEGAYSEFRPIVAALLAVIC